MLPYMNLCTIWWMYSKTCVKQPLSKRPKIGFQDQLLLNVGQKYCRMLQREHSAISLTFIELPLVIKIFFFVYFWVAILHKFYCISLCYAAYIISKSGVKYKSWKLQFAILRASLIFQKLFPYAVSKDQMQSPHLAQDATAGLSVPLLLTYAISIFA